MRFSKHLEDVLRAAGWTPDRFDQETADELERRRISKQHPAFKILTELGGLEIGETGTGEQCATSNVHFDLLSDDSRDAHLWSELLGSQLIGVAFAQNAHEELYVAADGRTFGSSLVHDAFYFHGGTVDEALIGLLRGKRAKPMLRPDQTHVILYGETFVASDPDIYRWQDAPRSE